MTAIKQTPSTADLRRALCSRLPPLNIAHTRRIFSTATNRGLIPLWTHGGTSSYPPEGSSCSMVSVVEPHARRVSTLPVDPGTVVNSARRRCPAHGWPGSSRGGRSGPSRGVKLRSRSGRRPRTRFTSGRRSWQDPAWAHADAQPLVERDALPTRRGPDHRRLPVNAHNLTSNSISSDDQATTTTPATTPMPSPASCASCNGAPTSWKSSPAGTAARAARCTCSGTASTSPRAGSRARGPTHDRRSTRSRPRRTPTRSSASGSGADRSAGRRLPEPGRTPRQR